MLFPTPAIDRQRLQISRDLEAGKIAPRDAAERLDELCGDGMICLVNGQERLEAGDLDGAEQWFWKGIERQPQMFTFYLNAAAARRQRDGADPMARRLVELSLWKLSSLDSIPEAVAEHFRSQLGDASLDYSSPETYLMAATHQDLDHKKADDPADVTERLLPYCLLNDLQVNAYAEVERSAVRETVENGARVAPLLWAALRDWARYPDSLDTQAVALFAAMLGEIGDAEVLPDLLELVSYVDREIAMHANWAVWRLGQRFPAEALEAFRQAAPRAHVSERCAIADQLALLPEGIDVQAVAEALLEGFQSFAEDTDAAYLLITVMALRGVDSEEHAGRYMDRYAGLLSRKGRAWMAEASADEDGFVPKLVLAGVDRLDIEDVCLGRELMDEEESADDLDGEDLEDGPDFDEDEDEGDFDEEDDEEPPQTVIAPPKPGRNDPCWCGSGKKYKKCHLAADEEDARKAADSGPDAEPPEEKPAGTPMLIDNQVHKRLANAVFSGAERWYPKSEWRKAMQQYFGEGQDVDPDDEEAMDLFLQWFLHDYVPRSTRRTAFAEFLRVEGNRLNPTERAIVESMRDARYGLYEVQRVEEGRGIEVMDVFRGDRLFIDDVTSSREVVKWDCLLARVEFYGGRHVLAGNGDRVTRAGLGPLKEFVETESRKAGQTPAEFVSANAHRMHRRLVEMHRERTRDFRMANALGEPIEFSSAEYRVVGDESAVVEALRGVDGLRENPPGDAGGHSFTWVEAGADGPARAYGEIEIAAGRLKLQCSTRQRLVAGRKLLEEALGPLVRHQIDRFETVEEAMRRTKKEDRGKPPKEQPPGIDPKIQAEIVGKMKREHYARWVDEALPALAGKTPREAIGTTEGRRAVRDLIHGIENLEEHERKRGHPAYDTNELWQILGLAED